jgi:hypothetical protein
VNPGNRRAVRVRERRRVGRRGRGHDFLVTLPGPGLRHVREREPFRVARLGGGVEVQDPLGNRTEAEFAAELGKLAGSSRRSRVNGATNKRPASKNLSAGCLSSGARGSQSWRFRSLLRPIKQAAGGHRAQRAHRPVLNSLSCNPSFISARRQRKDAGRKRAASTRWRIYCHFQRAQNYQSCALRDFRGRWGARPGLGLSIIDWP